jgi:hypothetical protein
MGGLGSLVFAWLGNAFVCIAEARGLFAFALTGLDEASVDEPLPARHEKMSIHGMK